MVKTAVLGSTEFIVGFELAGIKDTIEVSDNPIDDINKFKEKKEHGVVVIEEKIMENLDKHERIDVEDSIDPVFIPVSTNVEQDSLKRLIKKSIGVDLWE
ncbi:MAG: V-type ATP synthase subunit F [Candidatus Woesearchaeota archaeon]|jgi:vacuolar-type H+-ATPase subunit F/Vma7|nr:V-type ATP synthase subunit F [Candidatus Woesearchaeota archaeon]|tara:strand:- start:3942 stop:4241 length:300 start_codon:yes stop_codon:yes gene_type:complete